MTIFLIGVSIVGAVLVVAVLALDAFAQGK